MIKKLWIFTVSVLLHFTIRIIVEEFRMLLNATSNFLIAQYYIVILQVNYFYTSHKPGP
jgi:hypothetical protein